MAIFGWTNASQREVPNDSWPFWLYFLLVVCVIAVYITLDLSGDTLHNGDIDDQLRGLFLRLLLSSSGWYDLSLPTVRGPEIYISPWSRLIDAPYASIAFALQYFFGQERSIDIAFKMWPPILGAIYSILIVSVLKRLCPSKADLPVKTLLGLLIVMPYAFWEFSPGRIDHHNLQIVLLLLVIYGISRFDMVGGATVGVSVSVSTAVGLETLPISALILIALSCTWVFNVRGSRTMLGSTGIACFVMPPILMLVLIPPAHYWTMSADAFSMPYIQALSAFGLVSVLVSIGLGERCNRMVRGIILLFLGAAGLTCILLQYPLMASGPFSMITGPSRLYWFDRIQQEMTSLQFFRTQDHIAIALLATMSLTLVLAAPSARRSISEGRPQLPIIYLLACALLILVFLSNRFLRISVGVVPLLMPLAIRELAARWRSLSQKDAKVSAVIGCFATLPLALLLLTPKSPDAPESYDAFDHLLWNSCEHHDLTAISLLGRSKMMTPPALGLHIILNGPGSVSVSSIPFHRSAPAISRFLRTFMTSDRSERSALLADFDYLALCRIPRGLPGEGQMPLLQSLLAGEEVEGLEPMVPARHTDLMLFRVNHSY